MKKKLLCTILAIVMTVNVFCIPVVAETTTKTSATADVSEITLEKPVVTAKAKSEASVKLTWKSVDNATRYYIYYATSKNGKYTKYGYTTKTSCTLKGLEAETKYYFRVIARAKVDGKYIYSKYSAKVSATTKAAEYAGLTLTKSAGTTSRNEYATVSIVGKPSTDYRLTVYYSSTASTAAGTGTITSDFDGNATWKWKIGGKTKLGTYRIVISGGEETIETTVTVA